ncbi:hypothetical protein [Halovivax sp.]|uniref:hypothetical protein n=1 Tax=Halovivax sp. TaxID=1935978 RepID=UPI0025C1A73C|nr:hypothetical protein [Halovivax sp.]
MGLLELLEDEYVDLSSRRATIRELLELLAGSVLFVAVAAAGAWYLLGRTAGLVVTAVLALLFVITIVSQAYWAIAGREDYRE